MPTDLNKTKCLKMSVLGQQSEEIFVLPPSQSNRMKKKEMEIPPQIKLGKICLSPKPGVNERAAGPQAAGRKRRRGGL